MCLSNLTLFTFHSSVYLRLLTSHCNSMCYDTVLWVGSDVSEEQTIKMKAVYQSGSFHVQDRTTQRHVPEDYNPNNHLLETSIIFSDIKISTVKPSRWISGITVHSKGF